MGGGCRWTAAAILAAAQVGFCDNEARAASFQDRPTRLLLFSGVDLWRHGAFTYDGFSWRPEDEDEGFVFKLLIGGGLYRYDAGLLGGATVTVQAYSGSALIGWRTRRGIFDATLYLGPDVQQHILAPRDPSNRLEGTRAGVRGAFDLWTEPVDGMMLSLSLTASTVGSNYWTRIAGGWWLFDSFWSGPEIVLSGDDVYRRMAFGLHVTALRFGRLEWGLAGGWAIDSDSRDGFYGRLGVTWAAR